MTTNNPVYARLAARHLLNHGIDHEMLFKGTGLSYAGLWDSDEIEVGPFTRLLENAEALYPDMPVGFLIGSHTSTRTLGPLGVAMGAAPNVRAALQAMESFTRLHVMYLEVELQTSLRGMSVRFVFLEELGNSLPHHVEAAFLFLQHFMESVAGRRLDDAEYRASYAPPAYAEKYAEYLHSPVRFNHAVDSVELPPHWLEIQSPYFHGEVWNLSMRQLARRLKELLATEREVYARHIRALLRSQQPPLPAVGAIAANMHVSERTLNRRLKEENTSFRALRGEVLDEWACEYLRQTDASVEAIAAELGYQDAANFRRAFRSRRGLTPSEYRERGSA